MLRTHLLPILGGMKCLGCAKEIPDSFIANWEKSPQAKSGRFACPSCGAEYVRRMIGHTPKGKPLFSVRLWGHPKTSQKKRGDRGSR